MRVFGKLKGGKHSISEHDPQIFGKNDSSDNNHDKQDEAGQAQACLTDGNAKGEDSAQDRDVDADDAQADDHPDQHDSR